MESRENVRMYATELSHASVEKGLESEEKSSIIVMTKESHVSM